MATLLGWLSKTIKDTENNIGNFVNGASQNAQHSVQGVQQVVNNVAHAVQPQPQQAPQRAPQPRPVPPKPFNLGNFLNEQGHNIIDPFVNTGNNIGNSISSVLQQDQTNNTINKNESAIRAVTAQAQKNPALWNDPAFLAKVKAVSSNGLQQLKASNASLNANPINKVDPAKAAGDAAQVALTLGSLGTGTLIKAPVQAGITAATKAGAKGVATQFAKDVGKSVAENSLYGAAYGAAGTASSEGKNATLADVAKNAAMGTLTGAASGVALPVLGLAGKGAVKGVKVAAPQVAKAIEASKPTNHPAVLELNDHLAALNQQRDALAARGLSEGHPAMIANAKAYAQTAQARTDLIKNISQAGFAKIPGREPSVPESQSSGKQSVAKASIEQPQPAPSTEVLPKDSSANSVAFTDNEAGQSLRQSNNLRELPSQTRLQPAQADGTLAQTTRKTGSVVSPKQLPSSQARVSLTTSKTGKIPSATTTRQAQALEGLPGLSTRTEAPLVARSSTPNTIPPTPVVKQRGLVTSVKNSDQVSAQTRKGVSGTYSTRNTQQMANLAEMKASGDLSKATKQVNHELSAPDGTVSDQSIADAISVAKAHDAKGNFDQAQQIYDRLAEHGTKGGQAIQAFSLLKNRTPQGMKFQAIKALKKAGIDLSHEDQKTLQGHIENISKTAAGSKERDLAIHQLVEFVNAKVPSNVYDKAINFWRAGLLTSPKTTMGNILGNATEAATKGLWTNPIATAADMGMSVFTGKRTKTMGGGYAKGTLEGFGKAKMYLKTGFDERNPSAKFDAHQVNYKNPVVNKYVNGVYRWLGGQDQPFYYATHEQASRDLAKADGLNQGLKGAELDDYVKKSSANPDWKPTTFKTSSNAEAAAKYSVYQNDTLLGEMASGLKEKATKAHPAGGALANFLLPFSRVPASVAMRIIDRTPVGTTREVISQLVRLKQGKGFDQRAMAEAIGNGSFGVAVYAAGYALAKSGNITGAYPTDSKEQELWKSQGKQPYSVKVGGRWYSLNYMQPFGTILAVGQQIHDDMKSGKGAVEAWNSAGAAAAKSVESQSFLQGINGVLSAINDPQRSAGQYLNSTAGSIIPNVVKAAATATDSIQRDIKNPIDAIKGGIPGLRESLPAKQDMFGQSLPAGDTAANQLANPLKPTKVKNSDAVVSEQQRLQDSGNGIIPTQFNKSSIAGQSLTDQQVRDLQAGAGAQVHQVWSDLMGTSEYKQLSDPEKNTALKRAMDAYDGAAKVEYMQRNGMPIDNIKLSTVSKQILTNNYVDPRSFISSGTTSTTVGRIKPTSSKSSAVKKPASTRTTTKKVTTAKIAKAPKVKGIPSYKAAITATQKIRVPKITNYKKSGSTVAKASYKSPTLKQYSVKLPRVPVRTKRTIA